MSVVASSRPARAGTVAALALALVVAVLGTPASAAASVRLISSLERTDSLGQLVHVGEVINEGTSTAEFVRVDIAMYDAQDRLLDAGAAFTLVAMLKPGERAPYISRTRPPTGYDHSTVKVSFDDATEAANHRFTTRVTNDVTDDFGYRHLVGTVRNDNAFASEFVQVVASLRDASGRVVDADSTFVDTSDAGLAAGETGTFELLLDTDTGFTTYSLLTEAASQSTGEPAPEPTDEPAPEPTDEPTDEPAPADPATTGGAGFASLTPARLLDTRDGTGARSGKVASGGTLQLDVTGVGGVPASDVTAVVLNVTSTGATASGFVTAYPTGQPRPHASNLNYSRGQTIPNLVIAKVGGNGTVSLYNHGGSTHLLADVVGWYSDTDAAAGSRYSALTPARLLDTRDGTGARSGKVASGGTLQLDVTGVGGVPASDVTAVVLNVTSTGATASGFVTAYPTGQPRPHASNLNYSRGQTIPNLVIAKVGGNGTVSLYNHGGSTHLLADVVGWYSDTDAAAGSRYSALTPARLLDTRDGTGARSGKVASGGTLQLDVTGVGGVPASDVTAVVLNVTSTGATASGFVTAYPTGQPRPHASNLNYSRGQTIPNLVIAKVGGNGTVSLYNHGGSTHLLADVVGWYSAG